MIIWKNLFNIPKIEKDISLTIGNFDGVHKGHQKLLQMLPNNTFKVAITFTNHPSSITNNDLNKKFITTLEERLNLLKGYGIDAVILLDFTSNLSQKSGLEFIYDIYNVLPLKYLVLGENATFGYKRSGNSSTVKKASKELNFETIYLPLYNLSGEKVSSSLIRKYIAVGNIFKAQKLLGRPISEDCF